MLQPTSKAWAKRAEARRPGLPVETERRLARIEQAVDAIAIEMERRRSLADRNIGQVVELLERRNELRGIYPMADLVADNVGWIV